jgi:hypothetical protein
MKKTLWVSLRAFTVHFSLNEMWTRADRDQNASVAIELIKATKTLRKKPHITSKKPQFH